MKVVSLNASYYTDGSFVPVPLLESLLLRLHPKAEKVTIEATTHQTFQQR